MISPGFSLFRVDAGNLSKPANTLIRSISGAMGGLYEPKGIVRRAKAEAKAKLIEAEGDIAVSELQQRAAHRFIQQETLYQENSEKIISDALPHLNDEARPEDVSNDWYINFFDKARLISDEKMQILWSKILAGEANTPSSFSRRTVNFLQNMDEREAERFTNLCGFNFRLKYWQPIIFDENHNIYTQNGVKFESLILLDSIGLIKFSSVSRLTITVKQPIGSAAYFDETWTLEFTDSNKRNLNIGKAILTDIGQELAPISGSQPVPGFRDYVMEQWKKHSPRRMDDRVEGHAR